MIDGILCGIRNGLYLFSRNRDEQRLIDLFDIVEYCEVN